MAAEDEKFQGRRWSNLKKDCDERRRQETAARDDGESGLATITVAKTDNYGLWILWRMMMAADDNGTTTDKRQDQVTNKDGIGRLREAI